MTRGASPGLFDLADPHTGRTFTLYEFEVAVARMLDGRRRASEVIESGARLGIPIDLSGLNKFVRQLWHYGFLAAPGDGAPRPDEEPQGDRERWDEATRMLYQTGVRLARQGRSAEAASYLEAVLDADPTNAQASGMLAALAAGQSFRVLPIGDGPLPAAEARGRGARTLALAAAGVLAAGGALAAAVLGRTSSSPSPPPPLAPASPPAAISAARVRAPPPALPRWRTGTPSSRHHPTVAEIVAPGAGVVRWRAEPGAIVRAGDPVAELLVERTAGAPRPELARRVAELKKLAAADPVYRDFLEKARREQRAAVRGRVRRASLAAPAAGAVAREADDARVEAGATIGRIVDPDRWQLELSLEGDPPPADAACAVVGGEPADGAPCRLVAAAAAGARAEVTVEVSAAAAPWAASAHALTVRIADAGAPARPPPGEPR